MFDWTTGQAGFALMKFLLLDAALGRAGEAAPWVLQAAFPIGAIMTWRRIQQARNASPSPADVVSVPREAQGVAKSASVAVTQASISATEARMPEEHPRATAEDA